MYVDGWATLHAWVMRGTYAMFVGKPKRKRT